MKNIMRKYQESNIVGQKLLVIIFLTVYCLLLSGIKDAEATEITDIEITDYAVKIKTAAAMKYKLHKPDDPFRIVVDLEGAGAGKFKDTIYSSKAGVTEIKLSQIKTPIALTRLDILLSSPSDVRPEVKDNTLMLYIETLEKIEADHAKGDLAKEIKEVTFDKSEEGIEIVIKGDGLMPEPVVNEKDKIITIDIPMIAMKSELPKNISYPVKDIRYRTESGKVRFSIEAADAIEKEVFALDDEIIVDISLKQKSETESSGSKNKPAHANTASANSNLVSLDFQDADIVPILRLLGDVGKYNIVVHPEVKGIITMKLLNVPWEQALDEVLNMFSLEKFKEGNIIRIVPHAVFLKQSEHEEARKKEKEKLEQVESKTYYLNYAVAKDIQRALLGVKLTVTVDKETKEEKITEAYDEKIRYLTDKGTVSVHDNMLTVSDRLSKLREVDEFIKNIDKPANQVLIEARIVEMNTSFARDIGVQWGLMWLSDNWRNSVLGSIGSPVTGGQFPSAINLPAFNPTSAVTFGYLNAAQTFGLDLRLSAAESVGKAKIVSSPKILTIDNQRAEITHGTQVPIVTPGTANNAPTVTYKDANLKLVVTPAATSDGSVFLDIFITNDSPDFDPQKAISGNVPVNKREAKSKVLVKNGETIVIGGILKSREDEGERSVPGISKVPILGWLFKNEKKTIENQELLVFITPRIVN